MKELKTYVLGKDQDVKKQPITEHKINGGLG